MKKIKNFMLKKIKSNARLYDTLLFIKKVRINRLLINFIFQRVFRVNAKIKNSVHFTSIFSAPEKIIYNNDLITRVSFAVSGHCYMQGVNGIRLGKNFLFAPGLKIISANHDIVNSNMPGSGSPVKIGDNVWAGANVIIMPGVEIGDNCILGAGAVVTKSFEDNLVIVGNPAKVLRKRC